MRIFGSELTVVPEGATGESAKVTFSVVTVEGAAGAATASDVGADAGAELDALAFLAGFVNVAIVYEAADA